MCLASTVARRRVVSVLCRVWRSRGSLMYAITPQQYLSDLTVEPDWWSVISSCTEQLDTNNKILKANRANDAPVYLCANISPYCWSNTSHQWYTIAGTMHAVNCFKAPMRQLYVYMMRPIPSHWRLIEPYNKYIQSICSAHNARVKCNCKNSMKYDGALDNGHTRT